LYRKGELSDGTATFGRRRAASEGAITAPNDQAAIVLVALIGPLVATITV
jgi:hypothetical protein